MSNSEQPTSTFVPVGLMHFDPENPRLPSSVDGTNEKAVLDWMLKDATIIELMGAIGAKGYFPGEPLLVVKRSDDPESYTVIEGNRRLTAVKLLLQPNLAPRLKKAVEITSAEAVEKPEKLPILVFKERQEILDYLGYRHITGVKSWGSLAKTKYLAQLRDTLPEGMPVDEQFRTLAKIIGSRSNYVAKMLTGLAVYDKIVDNNFFDIKSINEDTIDFSVLTTALGYHNISDFLGIEGGKDTELGNLAEDNLREFTSWLFEKNSQNQTRLGESRQLALLNNVIGNERAFKAFKDGTPLKEAELLTEAPNQIFRNSVIESRSRLGTARDNFHLVTSVSSSDADNLLDIVKLARNLKTLVDNRIMDDGDE